MRGKEEGGAAGHKISAAPTQIVNRGAAMPTGLL